MRPPCLHRRRRSKGLALLELMISLLLGLFVVGAVLVNYASASRSGRLLRALTDMTEEAQLAMRLMTRDIQQSGDVDAIRLSVFGAGKISFDRLHAFSPVFGCNGSFSLPTAPFRMGQCSGSGEHAVEVSALARSATTAGPAGGASDCLGNAVASVEVASGVFGTFVSNRYYINLKDGVPQLMCASSSSKTPQPIAEQVAGLRLSYGIAPDWTVSNMASRRPVRYVSAADVADWNGVLAVRICLLMRSTSVVLEPGDSGHYLDCEGATQVSVDHHLYRAFHSSVALRNRMAF